MVTDDERRRVAERLRCAAEQRQPYTEPTLACFIGADCVDIWTRLADLIDPGDVIPGEVCELEGDGTPEGEPLPPIVDREALLSMAGDIEEMRNRRSIVSGYEYFIEVPRTLLDSIVSCIREACGVNR